MPDVSNRALQRRVALVAMLIVSLSGCARTADWLRGNATTQSGSPVILGAPDADAYLAELRALAEGDPASQAEIFADADAAATLTPVGTRASV